MRSARSERLSAITAISASRPCRGAPRSGEGSPGLPQVQALRRTLHDRVRLRQSARGAGRRRRGAGRRRRRPGASIRRAGRTAPDEDARGAEGRAVPGRGLHHQRRHVPASRQPQSRGRRARGVRALLRREAHRAPAQGHPGAGQRRDPESSRHARADRQASRPRAPVRLRGLDPDLPSGLPPAQPWRGVQAHGVGGSPARTTRVRPPPYSMTIADVAFDAPVRHSFSYRVPDGWNLAPGQRARAPLRGAARVGMVVAVRDGAGEGLKPLARLVDAAPVLSPAQLELVDWIAAQSLSSVGSTCAALLPPPAGEDTGGVVPLPLPATLVLLDEHEAAHKPPGAPRMHSRDVALERAAREPLALLLTAATPSAEAWWRAESGLIDMPSREPGPWPSVSIADTRGILRREPLTPPLSRAIRETLAAKRRVFLVVSRLTPFGWGAERVEHAVRRRFADARIARWDPDSARGARGEAQRAAAAAADVVIGTRGALRLFGPAALGLAAFVAPDQLLRAPDFRAGERTLALAWAAAERVAADGALIIQSQNPGHYAFEAVARQNLAEFYEKELKFRAELGYPPFRRLAVVTARARESAETRRLAEAVGAALRGRAGLTVYPPVADRRDRAHRIVAKGGAELPRLLDEALREFKTPGTGSR